MLTQDNFDFNDNPVIGVFFCEEVKKFTIIRFVMHKINFTLFFIHLHLVPKFKLVIKQ